MTIGKVSENIFPILINTVKEKIFKFTFIWKSWGLHISKLFVPLFVMVETCLKPQNLIFFEVIMCFKEIHYVLSLNLRLEILLK